MVQFDLEIDSILPEEGCENVNIYQDTFASILTVHELKHKQTQGGNNTDLQMQIICDAIDYICRYHSRNT